MIPRPANPAFELLQSAAGEALEHLAARRMSDMRVHATRKALKKARAALRLLRPALDDADYRAGNFALRDAGRCLSRLCDARSLLEVAGELSADVQPAALARLKASLQTQLVQARRAVADPATRGRCAKLICACRERLQQRELSNVGEGILNRGLRRIYRKGRKAFAYALDARTPQALHEWRKQIKYLLNAAILLRAAGMRKLRKVAKRADRTAELLGDDHDLAGLADVIRGGSFAGATRIQLLIRIEKRRAKLQAKAFDKGATLFAKEPRRFIALRTSPRILMQPIAAGAS